MTLTARLTAPALIGALLTATLVGCSAPAEEPARPDTSASEEAPQEQVAEPAGDANTAEWAKPVSTPGELITTISGSNFQVDVYQVGVTAATKTGNFVLPDTNEPVIAVGADIVYLNYVFTNTGSADIPLSYSLVTISARYADWPYLQGMDSITDSALEATMGINNSGIKAGAGDAPFAWAPGTSFSYGQNFLYQSGSAIDFIATLVPADENGDLNHDAREEVSVSSTIK